MKIRLFCFLSAIFTIAGLLLPVSVYAVDRPVLDVTVDVAVSVETNTTTPNSCTTSVDSSATEKVVADNKKTPTGSDDTGTTNQCQDDGGTYSSVSWNS